MRAMESMQCPQSVETFGGTRRMKFELSSEWKTRGGWKARIVFIDDDRFLAVHFNGDRIWEQWHRLDGTLHNGDFHLIEPWGEK